jgi:hypothetical protein
MYTCRNCENELNQGTEVCPYCGEDLTVAPQIDSALPTTKKKNKLYKTIFIWAVLIAALWGIVWYVLPPRPETAKPTAETAALSAMIDLHVTLKSYESAAGAYPSSLEALGESAKAAIRAAAGAGYETQFTPGAPNASGQIANYSLTCRPSNYGYRNFYSDETGVIHSTRENRPATAQDPVILFKQSQ